MAATLRWFLLALLVTVPPLAAVADEVAVAPGASATTSTSDTCGKPKTVAIPRAAGVKDRDVNVVVNCPVSLAEAGSPSRPGSAASSVSTGGSPTTAASEPTKCSNKFEIKLGKDVSFGVATGSEGLSWASLGLMGLLAIGTLVATALSLKQKRDKPGGAGQSAQSSPATVIAVLLALGLAGTLGYAIAKRQASAATAIVVSDEQLARVIPSSKAFEQLVASAASDQELLRNRNAALDKELAVCRAASAQPAASGGSAAGWLLLIVGLAAGWFIALFAGWFRDGSGSGRGANEASLLPTIRAAKALVGKLPAQTDEVSKALIESVEKLLATALGQRD